MALGLQIYCCMKAKILIYSMLSLLTYTTYARTCGEMMSNVSPLQSRIVTKSQNFGYRELKEMVQRLGISSKDEFVAKLPLAAKERVAKVFESRSFALGTDADGKSILAATKEE